MHISRTFLSKLGACKNVVHDVLNVVLDVFTYQDYRGTIQC